MHELNKLLHSAHHLTVFEAAARHCSFTRAADELNVSQPAVSTSIKQLEAALGVQLLVRRHRAVELTPAGFELANQVRSGFSMILDTARDLRLRHRRDRVTLSLSTAFANYWMVPRLAEFRTLHPDIDLRLQTTQFDLDLAREGLALGVRRGPPKWPDLAHHALADEILLPVASPLLEAYCRGIRSLQDLAHAQLIHLEEPVRPRPTWADWFAAKSVTVDRFGSGLRLNDYALVIQAAMAGEGIALGWEHLTAQLRAQRLLTRVGRWSWRTGERFYLVWPKAVEPTANALIVRDWIIEIVERS